MFIISEKAYSEHSKKLEWNMEISSIACDSDNLWYLITLVKCFSKPCFQKKRNYN
jgi:hypothetical protein